MTKFQDYFFEQIKNFNIYHSNLLIKTTEEDIHKIRTTLKRLKSFNILLDGLLFRSKDFPIEFINLFKLSGEIRDIQIQQKILEEYEEGYKTYLLYTYEKLVSEFKIKESFTQELQHLTDKLNLIENYHINDQVIKNVETYVQLSSCDIRNLVVKVSPENLHDIRKKIKRVYYTKLMLGQTDVQYIDDIQEKAGLWHDYDVTIENIRRFDNNLEIISSLIIKRDLLYSEVIELLKLF